jgi:hypothetical protein
MMEGSRGQGAGGRERPLLRTTAVLIKNDDGRARDPDPPVAFVFDPAIARWQ